MKLHLFKKEFKWYIILWLSIIQYFDYCITIPLVYLILYPISVLLDWLKTTVFHFPNFKQAINELRKFEWLLWLITQWIIKRLKNKTYD
jgi:hypothetical protein